MPFNVKYIEPKIILQSIAWMHFEYVWNIENNVLKSGDWNKEAKQNDIYYMDVGTCDGERKSNQNTILSGLIVIYWVNQGNLLLLLLNVPWFQLYEFRHTRSLT